MNLTLAEADVVTRCENANISISAIETLPTGGTHLVCTTSEGAESVRHLLKKHIIPGYVKRFAFYNIRRPW